MHQTPQMLQMSQMPQSTTRRRRGRMRVECLPILFSLLIPACGTTTPQSLPPQSVTPSAPSSVGDAPRLVQSPRARPATPETGAVTNPADEPPALVGKSPHPAEAPSNEAGEAEEDDTLVWIGARKEGQSDLSARLHAASASERRRRERTPPPIAVIDDENLAEYAKDVKVTLAGGQASTSTDQELESAQEAQIESARQEEYWRSEALRLRLGWRDAFDEIPVLEEEAARLRNEFYAADDPFYRDREIKPAWDRALDRIEEAKKDMVRYQEELEALFEKGRQAGALPGWLREGIELEPALEEEAEEAEAVPAEPVILGNPPR